MRDFFRGWRRKIGIATLLMALLFTCGFVRSRYAKDLIKFAGVDVSFQDEGLMVSYVHAGSRLFVERSLVPKWKSRDLSPPGKLGNALKLRLNWQWRWFGFARNKAEFATHTLISYWTFISPLTLLSAWLLLSKPRPAAPKQTPEPAPTTGT